MTLNAFISYKSEYRDFARKVRDRVREWGYGTWFDVDDIPKGEYFRTAIQNGLEKSQVVIGIVTPEAVESREVQSEWDWAYGGKCHLLLLLHQPTDLPYHLAGTQYIDFTTNPATGFDDLQAALKNPGGYEANARPRREPDATPPSKTASDNRQIMLDQVEEQWVHGVLDKAVSATGAFELSIDLRPEAILQHRDYGNYTLPDSAKDIHQVFEDMHGELLILGQPGSGKTILLLQLAEKLIAEARTDARKPIPVVFNLSSWAAKRPPFHEWLIEQLKNNYGVNKKQAEAWIGAEKLLPLLDGLDEVAEVARDACVAAINTFREIYRLTDVAVCSRVNDYDVLTHRLDVEGAITLQPLSDAQIADYLRGDDLMGVRELIAQEDAARTAAGSPFLLNVMKLVYRDRPYEGSPATQLKLAAGVTEEQRRYDILSEYETYVLDSNPTQQPKPDTRNYLRWLAGQLYERELIVFYLEDLQPDWLRDEKHFRQFRWSIRLTVGLSVGLVLWLFLGLLIGSFVGLFLGLLFGVLVGLNDGELFEMNEIDIRDNLVRFSLSREWLLFGVLVGLLSGILTGLIFGRLSMLFFCLLVGLLVGLRDSLDAPVDASQRVYPAQSVKKTLLNGLFGVVFAGPLFGVLVGLILTLFFGLSFGLLAGLFFGLMGSLSGGLLFGLADVFKHYLLRYFIRREGSIPRDYVQFLDHCANDLGLLRKVGGGYIFRHRYLLDYFAATYEESQQKERD